MTLDWRENATGDWLAYDEQDQWVGWCVWSDGEWHALTFDARPLGQFDDLSDAQAAVYRHTLGKPCLCEREAGARGSKTPYACHQCGRGQPTRSNEMAKKPTEDKPDNGKTETERFQQTLRCPLDTDELLKRGDRAAHLVAEHDEKQADLDNAKKQAKAELDRIEAEYRALCGHVRDKAEYRPIECEKLLDFSRWQVTVTRLDTGEVTSERPMTGAEREQAQTALPLEGEQGAAAPEHEAADGEQEPAAANEQPEGTGKPATGKGSKGRAKGKGRRRARGNAGARARA